MYFAVSVHELTRISERKGAVLFICVREVEVFRNVVKYCGGFVVFRVFVYLEVLPGA